MNFVIIDGDVYLATMLSVDHDVSPTSNAMHNVMVVNSELSGEMFLFRNDSSGFFGQTADTPNMHEAEMLIVANMGECLHIDDVFFTELSELQQYDKCWAAYTEWIATDTSVKQTEQISSRNISFK